MAILSIAIWFVRRAKPRRETPPEILARQELEPLRTQPENGFLLSRVTQILRRYVTTGFNLGCGELTTTEFCSLIQQSEAMGPKVSGPISDFLRQSDDIKFAPAPDPKPLCAVSQALKLIELAEIRRAELRLAEQSEEATKK